jgi:phosphatidylserine/phosphatidylglycerophosphate/cardiolipin synthase-like enzyme
LKNKEIIFTYKAGYVMSISKKTFLVVIFFPIFCMYLGLATAHAFQFAPDSTCDVCFTPQENCTKKITEAIKMAQQIILVQAYSLTSKPILYALISAANKGVSVKVIIDKSEYRENYWAISLLAKGKNIPIWVDCKLDGLAHNKVMVIDDKSVITGSFNFTAAAQKHNAENVLLINELFLARAYSENWSIRMKQSVALADFAGSPE